MDILFSERRRRRPRIADATYMVTGNEERIIMAKRGREAPEYTDGDELHPRARSARVVVAAPVRVRNAKSTKPE